MEEVIARAAARVRSDDGRGARSRLLRAVAAVAIAQLADLDATLAARGVRPSDLEDWRRIDEAEISRGGIRGSERTKIEAWHDLLDLVRHDTGPA